MRYLGLDLGTRTLGMAISDPAGIIATPYETARFSEKDLQKALEYVKIVVVEKSIDKIVMGLPKKMNGSLGFQSEYVLTFKEMLEKALDKEVIMIDERLTTTIVQRVMIDADLSRNKRKKNVDKLAAVVILQSYLDTLTK